MRINEIIMIWFLAVFMLSILILLSMPVRSLVYSVNSTLILTNSTIDLSINGYDYSLSNTVLNSSQQTNFSIAPEIQNNFINNTAGITLVCSSPENVSLKSESLGIITAAIKDNLNLKSDEITNKVNDNINFQLKPSQDKFDALEVALQQCNGNMTKLQQDKYVSDLQQEKWYFENNKCQKDNDTWAWITIGIALLFMAFFVFFITGGQIFSRKKVRL